MAANSKDSAKGARRRGPGRPFQPGKSGNPKGRPHALTALRDRIQLRGNDLVDELFHIVDDLPRVIPAERGPGQFVGPSHRDRIMAMERLLAYGYGKPMQAVELSTPDGKPIETRDVTPSPLTANSEKKILRLAELLTKAAAETVTKRTESTQDGRSESGEGTGGP